MSILLMVLVACSGGGDDTASKGDATAGAATYEATCQGCHGTDGALGIEIEGNAAAPLAEEVPEKSDEELQDITQNGYGTMPGQAVTDDEIPDLIAYLRETFPE